MDTVLLQGASQMPGRHLVRDRDILLGAGAAVLDMLLGEVADPLDTLGRPLDKPLEEAAGPWDTAAVLDIQAPAQGSQLEDTPLGQDHSLEEAYNMACPCHTFYISAWVL